MTTDTVGLTRAEARRTIARFEAALVQLLALKETLLAYGGDPYR